MSTESIEHRPRLNPFIFPADTALWFTLLIAAVLGASLFTYQSLFNALNRAEFRQMALQCGTTKSCWEPYEQQQALWMLGGILLILGVAVVIYWFNPRRITRRDGLTTLTSEDAPDLIDYLGNLARDASLTHQPTWLWNPLNPAKSGLAFGRLGRYYVALNGGLVTLFFTDRAAFRAILLHELAHLKNADVDRTYFAVAVWYAFLIASALPFAVSLVSELIRFGGTELGFILGVAWRGVALAVVVYLTRNAVLRTRETYADVRASIWDGTPDKLAEVLQMLPGSASRWQRVWQVHPQPIKRRDTLFEPQRLFRVSVWTALGTGVVATIAFSNVQAWLMLWLPTDQENLAFFLAALLFASLTAGVLGVGLWRAAFVERARNGSMIHTIPLGVGLGIGLLLGQTLSWRTAVSGGLGLPEGTLTFAIGWTLLLLLSMILFLRWIADCASAWLDRVVSLRSLQVFSIMGLVISSVILAVWWATLFLIGTHGDVFLDALKSDPQARLEQFAALPLTFVVLIGLWAYPLASGLRRKRIESMQDWRWAFLDPIDLPLPNMRRARLRVISTARAGLVVGLVFCGLLLVTLPVLHVALPAETRSTTAVKSTYLQGQFTLAVLMQLILVVIVASRVKRLGWAHGLCAAFVAGCVMTIGAVGMLQLGYCVEVFAFGPGHTCAERIDAELVSFFAQYIIQQAAALALPAAIVAATVANLVRHFSREAPANWLDASAMSTVSKS